MQEKQYAAHTKKGNALSEMQRHLDKRNTLGNTAHRWTGVDMSSITANAPVQLTGIPLEVFPFNPDGLAAGDDALVMSPEVCGVMDLRVFKKELKPVTLNEDGSGGNVGYLEVLVPTVDGVNNGNGAANKNSAYFDWSSVGMLSQDIRKLKYTLDGEGYATFELKDHGLPLDLRTQNNSTSIQLRLGGETTYNGGVSSSRRNLTFRVIDEDHLYLNNVSYSGIEAGFSDTADSVHKLLCPFPILRNGGGKDLSSFVYDFMFHIDLEARNLYKFGYMDD